MDYTNDSYGKDFIKNASLKNKCIFKKDDSHPLMTYSYRDRHEPNTTFT